MERRTDAKRYVRQMSDRLCRSERTQEWSQIGCLIHSCFKSIRTETLGLTEDTGYGKEIIGGYNHSGGTDPPWTYIASPMVLAGKAWARGSYGLPSDCPQSEPQSHLPTGSHVRGLSVGSDLTRNRADSVDLLLPSVHPESRTEHRDGILPMVTSELEQNSRIPSQGSDRQPPVGLPLTEDHVVVQEQAREVTVRKSRPRKSSLYLPDPPEYAPLSQDT
jgi:hypothetical protein